MENDKNVSQCITTPALAIHGASSALVKYGSNFTMKINGVITGTVTAADAPSLALATLPGPLPNGTASVVASLPADAGATDTGILSCQAFALIATIPDATVSPTPVFTWRASTPFSKYVQPNTAHLPQRRQHNECVVGWVIVQNGSAGAFVPGTTVLDTASLTVTYLNNYALDPK